MKDTIVVSEDRPGPSIHASGADPRPTSDKGKKFSPSAPMTNLAMLPAPQPSAEAKAIRNTISVSREQQNVGKDKDDLADFTPSDRMMCTPSQQLARIALPPGGPSKQTQRPKKPMTPFDIEENESSESERANKSADEKITLEEIDSLSQM